MNFSCFIKAKRLAKPVKLLYLFSIIKSGENPEEKVVDEKKLHRTNTNKDWCKLTGDRNAGFEQREENDPTPGTNML